MIKKKVGLVVLWCVEVNKKFGWGRRLIKPANGRAQTGKERRGCSQGTRGNFKLCAELETVRPRDSGQVEISPSPLLEDACLAWTGLGKGFRCGSHNRDHTVLTLASP